MKILAPTDFSAFSNYAFETACQIAEQTGAELHLFHAAGFPNSWDAVFVAKGHQTEFYQSVASNVQARLETLQEKAAAKGITAEIHFSPGHFMEELKDLSIKEHFDVVVMGSKGANAKEEWFIGTNTQKAIRQLHQNVLVVKEPIKERLFSKIVFSTGLFIDDQKALLHLLDFLKPFQVEELHIVAIDHSMLFGPLSIVMEDTLQDFKGMVKNIPCYTHYLKGLSVDEGIRQFSAMEGIDLIAISNHTRHPLKRIFAGSNVEMIVNHAEVPVLSLDFVAD